MTNYTEYFNPKLEEVLQDIAKDPKAKLLDIPSSGQLVCATHDFRVGVAAPGLTAAEVELLTVHREELGELLKQRCLIEFFAQPDADIRWDKSVTVDRHLEVPNEQIWQGRTEQVITFPFEDEKSKIATDVLKKCVTGNTARPVSITQLAMAMLRVDPKDQARIYIASEHLREGRLDDAKKTAQAVVGQTTNLLGSYSEDLIGRVAGEKGQANLSLEAYSRSFLLAPNRVLSLMSGVALAVEFGDKGEALRFGGILNDLIPEEHPSLTEFCGSICGRIANDRSLLGNFDWGLADELLSKFGNSPAGRIVYAHTN